jgi:hypothetical protein
MSPSLASPPVANDQSVAMMWTRRTDFAEHRFTLPGPRIHERLSGWSCEARPADLIQHADTRPDLSGARDNIRASGMLTCLIAALLTGWQMVSTSACLRGRNPACSSRRNPVPTDSRPPSN